MKTKAFLLIIIIFLIGCQSKIEGEGNANSIQEYAIDTFSLLDVKCNCNLTLIPSQETKVVIESHENLIQNLKVNLKRNKLTIEEISTVEKFSLYNVNIYFDPQLKNINLGQQTKMKISGTMKAKEIIMNLSDNAILNNAYLELKTFDLEMNDQSQATINGTAIDQNISTNDESIADLSNLQGVDVKIKAKKNSNLTVNAMKSLSGTAYDNAKVYFLGDPKKDISEKDRATIQNK